MTLDFHAGKRILYKNGSGIWKIGELKEDRAELTSTGLYLPIIPKEYIGMTDEIPEIHWAEINQIFTDAVPLDDWMKNYPEYFMTKEQYAEFIESDEFDKNLENAYMSDGEYVYYQINKYNKTWLDKQPLEYVVRYDS